MSQMATLDVLPGEDETKTIVSVRRRVQCEFCEEPAHFRHTFLLANARQNPASSAYGHDDCTYCHDTERFSCRAHEPQGSADSVPGYGYCATFPANKRFAHLFLKWSVPLD
jgi:hypothetical protein